MEFHRLAGWAGMFRYGRAVWRHRPRNGDTGRTAFTLAAADATLELEHRNTARTIIRELAAEALAAGREAEGLALCRRAAAAGDHEAVEALLTLPGLRDDPAGLTEVLEAAVESGDVRALPALAGVYARRGDLAAARDRYRRGIDAGDVDAILGYAAFAGENGELDAAIADARRRAGTDARALAELGALLLATPDGQPAGEAVLRRGAAVLENRSRALLASVLVGRGETAEASALIRRVLATGDDLVRPFAERLAARCHRPGAGR